MFTMNPFKILESNQFKNVLKGVAISFVGLIGLIYNILNGNPTWIMTFNAIWTTGIVITMHQAYAIETRYNLGDGEAASAVEQSGDVLDNLEEMGDPKKMLDMMKGNDIDLEDEEDLESDF